MKARIVAVRACDQFDESSYAIRIEWESEKGFGTLDIEQTRGDDEEIHIHMDTELMGREYAKEILCSLVDQAVLDTDE